MLPPSQCYRSCTATETEFADTGYAAIKPVLIDEGVYFGLCSKQEIEDGITPCYGQEIRSATESDVEARKLTA